MRIWCIKIGNVLVLHKSVYIDFIISKVFDDFVLNDQFASSLIHVIEILYSCTVFDYRVLDS
jgi:hypothetical protein